MIEVSTKQLIASLQSELCPACGGKKRPANTFCSRCYFSLGTDLQRRLYNRVGAGYEEAVQEAAERLNVKTLQLPAEK